MLNSAQTFLDFYKTVQTELRMEGALDSETLGVSRILGLAADLFSTHTRLQLMPHCLSLERRFIVAEPCPFLSILSPLLLCCKGE